MTVLAPAHPFGPEPAADDNGECDDGDDENGQRPSGKTCPLHVNKGESPCVLPDGIVLRFEVVLLCQLLPVQTVEAPVFTELGIIVVGAAHFEIDLSSSFSF